MSHSQSCYTLPNYPHKPKLLRSYLLRLCAFALATVLVFQTHPCQAQPPNDLETLGVALLQPNQGQHSGIGIGEISIVIGQMASDATLRVIATEAEDRILYPAIEIVPIAPDQLADPPPRRKQDRNPDEDRRIGDGSVLRRLRTAVDKLRDRLDPKEHLRIRFLFVGQAPLRIQLTGELERSIELTPRLLAPPNGPGPTDRDWNRMLEKWWVSYVQQAKQQLERSDYPSFIERHLIYSLANRFGFPVPRIELKKSSLLGSQSDPTPTLELIAGAESLQDNYRHELLTTSVADRSQRVAIPQPPRWKKHPIPKLPEGTTLDSIPVEEIAKAVPPESLYIRFGSFQNYLWFQRLGESRGGDIAQLAMLRGYNYETSARIDRLLNTQMTTIGKLFGNAVISDMAIVGYDLYLQDGPTMGVIFQARNFDILRTSLEQERQSTLANLRQQGATLQDEEIEGTTVTFLSTPDQSVRSFLVQSEPYLFITSSRTLAKRFIQVRKGETSLADVDAFRFTRLMMPLDNDYDVFAYLSSDFFQNLISPRYQIELKRRMRAVAAIENVELASIVAKREQKQGFFIKPPNVKPSQVPPDWMPGDQIDYLIANGYLPTWFQKRVDGSETIRFADNWHDSVRGRRGSFLPIADVPLVDCTPEESAEYRRTAEYYSKEWQQTDPLMIGLRRYEHPERADTERIALEAYIAPLGSDKYGWMSLLLAPPSDQRIELPQDDIVSLQLHLRGNESPRDPIANHFLFAGLKDTELPFPEETKGLFAILRLMKTLPAYLGAWPKPAVLDRLPLGLAGGPPDSTGFSKTWIGLWRWQLGGFSILSFQRQILEACAETIRVDQADDVAQGRLSVGNLAESRVAGWFNTLGFRQAAQTTRGNLFLLDAIQQQLGLPPDKAKTTAERLLDAKLQCTLGGEYALTNDLWQSTAWPKNLQLAPGAQASSIGYDTLHTVPPESYKTPWLEWFRGGTVHLTQLPERLVVVGQVDMASLPKRNVPEEKSDEPKSLPKLNFDIFNLPFKAFNSDKPENKSKQDPNKPAEKDVEKRRKF